MNRSRRTFLFTVAALPIVGQKLGSGMIVVLIGAPGAGKTTQAELLQKRYGLRVLSAAEVLRKNKKTFKGGLAAKAQAGDLLSDDSLNSLMLDAIKKSDHSKGFILDGYPASKAQADFLAGIAAEQDLRSPVTVVLDIPDEIARKRLLARKDPGDSPENIDRRIAGFHSEWEAIKAAYPSVRIFTVDGTRSKSEVFQQIAMALESEK
jgi:adenylate kinase